MRFFRSLQGKILFFFVLINVTTVAVLTATVSANAREALETKIEDQLRLKARVASRSLDEQLALKWAFMKSLATNTFLINSNVIDLVGRGEYLEPFMQRLQLPGVGGEQTDVWLLDVAGHLVARNTKHTSHSEHTPRFSEEGWWPRMREGQPVAMLSVREGRSRLLLAFPVVYQQRTQGAVVAEFDVELLREHTSRDGFDATLLAPLGPLFGTISAEALGRVREVGPGTGQLSTFVLGDTFYLVEPLEGFMRERDLGWSLVLSVPVESISSPVNELRRQMLGTGVVMATLFAVLVVWGTRGLLRPLERIEDTMRHIFERGDLSQRIRLESRDELGSIARTFDQMLERLERHTAELERSRDQLALLAHITAAAPSSIVMLDTQARVCVWNQSAERLFGWSREEISEGPFLERVVPASLRSSVAELIARADTGTPAEAELSLVTRQAGAIPVLVTVTRISDAAGGPTGHVFIVQGPARGEAPAGVAGAVREAGGHGNARRGPVARAQQPAGNHPRLRAGVASTGQPGRQRTHGGGLHRAADAALCPARPGPAGLLTKEGPRARARRGARALRAGARADRRPGSAQGHPLRGGRALPGAARAGGERAGDRVRAAQPHGQCAGRHAHRGLGVRERAPGDGGQRGGAGGERHRRRHDRGSVAAGLRSLLHDEARRAGDRPRDCPLRGTSSRRTAAPST